MPRPGQVLGIVGNNGIGKSTALRALSGKAKPNLGRLNVTFFSYSPIQRLPSLIIFLYPYFLQNPPDWQEISDHFKGTELQTYFDRIRVQDLKVSSCCFDIPNNNYGLTLS